MPTARLGQLAHGHRAAGLDRAVVDALTVGMDRETVGDDQRGAAIGRGSMHRDRDHAAERQAADMGAVDVQRVHRGEDRGGEIVAVGSLSTGSLSP